VNAPLEAAQLHMSIVSDVDSFAEMADEWRTLTNEVSASFFMSWEWHYTWWEVYSSPKDRLYLVRFTLGDKLVGLLPMYSRRQSFELRHTLMFLGTGEAREDEVATEYLDLIAHPIYQREITERAMDWLCGCEQWGVVELRFMLENALLVQAYKARESMHTIERNVGNRYRVDLELDESAHLALVSKSRSKRIERSRRALVRDGGLEQTSVSSINELSKSFDHLAELNHERQAHKRRKSAFASTRFNRFHRKIVERTFDKGGVNIHQFKLKHASLAVLYCFYDEHTCFYYQSGFTKRASNKYMPLTFAHLSEMQRNRESGRRYYDLMRAEPPSYKEDFGCETTPMLTTFIFCSKWRLRRFNLRKKMRRSIVAALRTLGIKRN